MQARSRQKRSPINTCCLRVGLASRSTTSFTAVVLLLAKAVDARGDVLIYVADELTPYEKGVVVATWFWRFVATIACIAMTIDWCVCGARQSSRRRR